MKFNFIMFCHNNSFKQKSDIIKQVKYIYPDSIQTIYSAEDLPKEINDYADLYPRGYGYYLWKPYIILQKLNEISDNDIILNYLDSKSFSRKYSIPMAYFLYNYIHKPILSNNVLILI